MRKLLPYLLGSLCAFAAVGCGGSGETILGTEQNPRVRAINFAATTNPVDIRVNNETILDNAAFNTVGTYRVVENGTRNVDVFDSVTNGVIATTDPDPLFELSQYYSVVAYNSGDSVQVARVLENRNPPAGQGQVRVVNLANGVGTVDVYLTEPSADITGATPTSDNLAFGTPSTTEQEYARRAPGTYRIRITPSDSQNVIFDQNVTLDSGSAKTLYFVRNSGANRLIEVNDRL